MLVTACTKRGCTYLSPASKPPSLSLLDTLHPCAVLPIWRPLSVCVLSNQQMMMILEHKSVADAAFVVSRMVPPAAMTPEWLTLFAKVCFNIKHCVCASRGGGGVG